MTPSQCRAARALLGWTQTKLGEKAGVARKTIFALEIGRPTVAPGTLLLLERAFAAEGLVLIGDGWEGVKRPAEQAASDAAERRGSLPSDAGEP